MNVIDNWFCVSTSNKLDDILSNGNSLMYQFLRRDKVSHLLADHKAGRCDYYKILYNRIVVEECLRSVCY